MVVRNCAFAIGACIILAIAAPRTYGQVPGGGLHPQQVLLLADAAGSICNTVLDAELNRRNPDLANAPLKTDEQIDDDVRAQFGELFQKMARSQPGWLAINLNGDEFEGLVRAALVPHGRNNCQEGLAQLIVDTIYHRPPTGAARRYRR
jgi:hypothetical protein